MFFSSSAIRTRLAMPGSAPFRALLESWQPDREGGPVARFARYLYVPVVLVDDAMDDRQPEPGTVVARGDERVEDLVAHLVGDARSRVREPDEHESLVGPGLDRQGTSAEHGLHGVADEVHEHLLQLLGVGDDVGSRV